MIMTFWTLLENLTKFQMYNFSNKSSWKYESFNKLNGSPTSHFVYPFIFDTIYFIKW